MNVLAARQLLTRRKRQGTFIGPKTEPIMATISPCVHCLIFFDDIASDMALFAGEVISGLNHSLPGVSVKTHFGPVHDALSDIRKEVSQVASDPSFEGFVLWLGVREVQELLAESGLRVVVHGGVYPGINLPYVEHDQREIGRLMAREAILAGHKQLVFVNRQTWGRGDSLALDGVLAAIHESGLGHQALHVRNVGVSSIAPSLIKRLGSEQRDAATPQQKVMEKLLGYLRPHRDRMWYKDRLKKDEKQSSPGGQLCQRLAVAEDLGCLSQCCVRVSHKNLKTGLLTNAYKFSAIVRNSLGHEHQNPSEFS